MTSDMTRGPCTRRLALVIGFVVAPGGCGQLAASQQQPPAQSAPGSQQQTASVKLPPF
jgi:hypothetical protein